MKLKRFLFGMFAVLFTTTLVACGDNNNGGGEWTMPSTPMQVFVGSESTVFYQTELNAYVKREIAAGNLPEGFKIEVTGVNSGSYADTYLRNPEDGPDLFVVAQDNLGKLLAGDGTLAPIENQELIEHIEANNDEDTLNSIYMSVAGSEAKYYAVPIIKQSLVLYYNTKYFKSASACDTWEEILEVASKNGKLAVAYTGEDGFNYSHWTLAKPVNSSAKKAFGTDGTLELYNLGLWSGNYLWGDDQVAIHKYAQEFTQNPAGRNGAIVSASGWKNELGKQTALTVIGGAWDYNTVVEQLGEGNFGITVLPKFTLKSQHAFGTAKSGMQFQSGSFFDVKCLMKKKKSAYAPYLDQILLFLSSEDVQARSYIECNNLPTSSKVKLEYTDSELRDLYSILYSDFDAALDDEDVVIRYNKDLADAQLKQGEKAGMPQPFGSNADFNPAYYAKTSPLFVDLHQDLKGEYTTTAKIKERLQWMSYILAKNDLPKDAQAVKDWVETTGR